MPKTRTFVALALTDPVLSSAGRAIDRLRNAADGVRWAEEASLHVTLHFLGDLSDQEVALVCSGVQRVADATSPFDLHVHGLGAFPSVDRPRTVWLGVEEGADALVELFNRLIPALEPVGLRVERRPYVPHVTLGRVDRLNPGELAALRERMERHADYEAGGMLATKVTVFASRLHRDGPEHLPLAQCRFKGA